MPFGPRIPRFVRRSDAGYIVQICRDGPIYMGTMPAMDAEIAGSATSADEAGDTVVAGGASPIAAGVSAAPTADPEGLAFSHVTRVVLLVGAVCAVAAGLTLRFWTKSDLWLDEALTVSIARKPLHELPAYLKRDGAPPLFYVLLHGWTGIFGTSNLAVRALPGVIGVATLPLAWLAGKRLAGTWAAWAAMLLVATSQELTLTRRLLLRARQELMVQQHWFLLLLLTPKGASLPLPPLLPQMPPNSLLLVGQCPGLLPWALTRLPG